MTYVERRNRPQSIDVLVVDDEDDIRELLELSLMRMGLACDAAGTLQAARELLAQRRYRLCLTDMRLPDGDGLELVEHIQTSQPGLPVAVITAYGSIATAIRALKLGAFDFVTKPVELKALRELVSHALKLKGADEQAAAAPAGARALIGQSPAFLQLRTQAEKLARNQAPVFIHGESGTGKEVIARHIHSLGARAAGPFVPVNCGAISPELMESEFFGHRKGSFTGAGTDKEGLFQAASGGTLFLDEIGELPLGAQTKLLRAVEERTFLRVGGTVPLSVDVRLVVATNRDLAQRVKAGAFREDLYYRLDVFPVKLPPLRARREDVPELARAFARSCGEGARGKAFEIGAGAAEKLAAWDWPGNVRELKNVVERAVLLAEGSVIRPADVVLGAPGEDAPTTPTLDGTLEETGERWRRAGEAARIRRALEEAGGDRAAAAAALDIPLKRLAQRLRDLKL
mgnify:CR=1 FL=1